MSLAMHSARNGITVDSVTRGVITAGWTAAVPPDAMVEVVARIPVGRLGEPEELAGVGGLPGRSGLGLHHQASPRCQRRAVYVPRPTTPLALRRRDRG
jgi:NAD(P)-dependent dehydrogenase (short-subunit alcohol dehydrogenase family)